ncbi:amino acid permease-associated region [Desulfocucumis palustris]|uniref:Amino acid permease-associated region n=1 Tax=Desulfocucumis palustris TaxID=1898651 RepID=A0A2L2XGG7_9FIRM|nr:APC family permease [Desulfocucumis palustris]GBF35295.1 amino acid permease-associated region [Desulfocucumis palustris]
MSDQNAGFDKVLGKFDVFALAFGAMIGWGWVILTGDWINAAGSIGAMLAFGLGSAVVIFVGLAYSELTAAMPKVGGEHVFCYRAMGITASFIATWSIILSYISVVAFEAVALPTVIEYLIPGYYKGYLWTVAGWDVYASWVAVGVIASIILTIANYFGVKTAALLQSLFTIIIFIAGVLLVTGSLFNGSTAKMEPLFVSGAGGMMTVLIMTPFMFVGFNVIPQAAEEINLPYKSIGKVLILSVIMAAAFYMLIIFGVSRSLTAGEMTASKLVTADAMAALFGGHWAGKLLILGGIAGIVSSWNGFYIGASRAIYAMARSKMLPEFLGYMHPKYKTPSNAILLIGALSTLAPLFGRKMLVWLVDAGGLSICVAYLLVCIAFIILRNREPEMSRPFKVSNGKFIGYIAIILSMGFVLLYLPGSPSALVWPYEWVIVGGWTIMGIIFYYWARRTYGNEAADSYMRKEIFSADKQ